MKEFNTSQPSGESVRPFSGFGPVSVLIQITEHTPEGFGGVALPLCGDVQPFAFSSLSQLTALLDALCDRLGRPVREESLKRFSDSGSHPVCFVPAKPAGGHKLGHFTIEVLYRQNQSMQGRMIVPDRGEIPSGTKCFRSDMELLNLMREYMTCTP